jgi:RNA polymerase sigma-70 factor (ECF subfamily)
MATTPDQERPRLSDLEHAAEQILSGDVGAFRQLVEATTDRMFRLSARIMGSLADAEDVVQEAYVKAYQALRSGGFDRRSRVDTWLYRVVTNTAIDALRTRKRRRAQSDEAIEPEFDGVASVEARVALVEIEQLLGALPADQRAAVALKALEGLTSAEVAEILECSEGAVEQRLVRARATLRQLGHGA